MDGGNGAKTVVYNTKENSKKRETEKEIQERKKDKKRKESERLKKYNSKKEGFFTINHIVRACSRMLFACVHV